MTRTAKEVAQEFRSHGISIARWARHNGFSPALVYQVLQGRSTPARGQSHQIAVVLGLKEGSLEQELDLINCKKTTEGN
jgi:gp16 family phage-associated protein